LIKATELPSIESIAIMPASSEFITLCQSQVALLTQGLGAALTIVYLTEELSNSGDTHLIPAIAHPEAALDWGEEQIFMFLTQVQANLRQRLLTPKSLPAVSERLPTVQTVPADPSEPDDYRPVERLLPQQQIVRPLIYQERVVGLLLTARAERAWTESEQTQIEQIAQTLTLACLLDWRSQWLTQDLQRQQLLEERKTDLYDDLLHQFRNPLTALRTFGKLLIKRLSPADANHSVVESIVRESDRLQELLKQLDAAIDLDVTDLVPVAHRVEALPPATLETIQTPGSQLQLPEAKLLLGSAVELEPHSLLEVLRPLLDSASAIAQDRQLNLRTDLPLDLPPVPIDLRALREVMNNLIDNALKYTPAQGTVYIGLQRQFNSGLNRSSDSETSLALATSIQAAQQVIIVADTGPGIPPNDLQHLFMRHYRGIQANTDIPGTGLGLAIARELVQQMNGKIQILSPALTSSLLPDSIRALYQTQPESGTVATVSFAESP
jgi:signal transduction histidine kinase